MLFKTFIAHGNIVIYQLLLCTRCQLNISISHIWSMVDQAQYWWMYRWKTCMLSWKPTCYPENLYIIPKTCIFSLMLFIGNYSNQFDHFPFLHFCCYMIVFNGINLDHECKWVWSLEVTQGYKKCRSATKTSSSKVKEVGLFRRVSLTKVA